MKNGILVGIASMAMVVVTSNVLVQFLLGDWLTWGAITYPVAFFVTDITNRLYGVYAARKVVFFGFIVGIICSLVGTKISGEFGPLVSFRVAIGSGSAFLVAQLIDVSIFDKLRSRKWWIAPFSSSMIGSSVDTFLFFSISFSTFFIFLDFNDNVDWANEIVPLVGVGPNLPLWISLGLADFLVKVLLAMCILVPFKLVTVKNLIT